MLPVRYVQTSQVIPTQLSQTPPSSQEGTSRVSKPIVVYSAKNLLKKKKGGGRIVSLNTTVVPAPRFPPEFDASPTYFCRRRWVSDENVNIGASFFTQQNGHNQFLICTSSGNALCWVDMWRIKKISVWTINYVDNATSVTIAPATADSTDNNFNDREAAYSISSRSEAEPGHMSIVPARDTPLGAWHKTSTVNNSGQLFQFIADYGGASTGNWATITLDVEFEFVPHMIGSPNGYTTTTSATTVGVMGGKNIFVSGTGMLLTDINNLT
jgi:hypothetical protein